MIINYLAFFICLIAFVFGAFKLFRKDVPVYYKICICSVGCYALGLFSCVVFDICKAWNNEGINISLLGLFGCLCFFVSANLGGDDIHEREEIKLRLHNKELVAYIAPLCLSVCLVVVMVQAFQILGAVECAIMTIVYLPAIPSSFLALLYLMKPKNSLGLFKFTKLCNLCILLFCLTNIVYLYMSYVATFQYADLLILLNSLLLATLTYDAVRGAKKWKV